MIFTNYADLEEFCAHKNELKKKKKNEGKKEKSQSRRSHSCNGISTFLTGA